MKKGLRGGNVGLSSQPAPGGPRMLYAGLDLSRQRLDVHVLDEEGRTVEVTTATPDVFGLRELVARIARHGEEVSATIESMNGARFVHDQLELYGWDVEIADAVKVKGLAPLAAKTDKIDAWVLAELGRLAIPEPWATTVGTSLRLVDELDAEIAACERELRSRGADHPYVALLQTVPGIAWVLGYTIAAELGDIGRFSSPKKLAGYTGLCPLVRQSGRRDDRGPLAKNGPKYLRWALIEAATHAARHPAYRERYEHTKQRLGRQRGSKVARVELARELTTAIWHMLTKNESFAPGRPPARPLVA